METSKMRFKIERDILKQNKELLDKELQEEYNKLDKYIQRYWK